mmetsp:Transcript_4007/g.11418  ORF Transcript_4007/g.11418 Transcript_4007/m.11418 type:complete len:220 (+) Transcript_4007:45-704(+)
MSIQISCKAEAHQKILGHLLFIPNHFDVRQCTLEGTAEFIVDLVAFILAGLADVDLTTGAGSGMLVAATFVAKRRTFLGAASAAAKGTLHLRLTIINVVEARALAGRQFLVAVVKVTHVRAAQALLLAFLAKILVVTVLVDLAVFARRIVRVALGVATGDAADTTASLFTGLTSTAAEAFLSRIRVILHVAIRTSVLKFALDVDVQIAAATERGIFGCA